MEQNASRTGQNIHRAYDDTRHKLSQYIYSEPQEITYVEPAPASFCYQVLMDIICYNEPQPDMHLNLISVQGDHGYGYEDFLPNEVKTTSPTTHTATYSAPHPVSSVPQKDGPFYASPSPSVVDQIPEPAADPGANVPVKLMAY